MVLNKDFREFIGLLNSHNVRYLVVGGYAVTFHGYPRFTNDLDIWIERASNNAEAMINVLEDFGFGTLEIKKDDFLLEDRVIQLGYPPNRIDLLTGASGLIFDQCYPKKVSAVIEGLPVDFIDIENLKINKKTTRRYRDLNDLENLEKI